MNCFLLSPSALTEHDSAVEWSLLKKIQWFSVFFFYSQRKSLPTSLCVLLGSWWTIKFYVTLLFWERVFISSSRIDLKFWWWWYDDNSFCLFAITTDEEMKSWWTFLWQFVTIEWKLKFLSRPADTAKMRIGKRAYAYNKCEKEKSQDSDLTWIFFTRFKFY